MDTEFAQVEAARIEIDRQIEANAVNLRACPPVAPIVYQQGASAWVQTQRCSPAREQLLREQRELFQRRNEIYARWAAVKTNLNETK
jgi:hypothetical protein